MNKSIKLAGLSAAVLLAACSSDDGGSTLVGKLCDFENGQFCAVVNVVAPDYSGADVQIIDGDRVSSGLLPVDESDYGVDAYGQDFYRIGRYNIDAISKYGNSASLNDKYVANGKKGFYTGAFSNPYRLEFISSNEAYLPLYGSEYVWQVNPAANNEPAFKIDTKALDLGVYSDNDGKPETFAVKSVGNELFVFMQRLDNTPVYPAPSIKKGSYVAVFDRSDLTQEVPTGEGANGFDGIELPAQNPISVDYHPSVGFLLAAVSDYNKTDKQAGIIKVDPATYKATLLVGDETGDGDPSTKIVNAAFSAVAIADKDNAFFVAYVGWENNDVYHLNLQTNAVTQVAGLTGKNIGALTASPDGNIWVGVSDASDPHIQVMDKTGVFVERHSLSQNPNSIAFMTK